MPGEAKAAAVKARSVQDPRQPFKPLDRSLLPESPDSGFTKLCSCGT